jgi:hypothetical protein
MTVRPYALDFLTYATNGPKGVARGDAPYERVTEGRHVDGLFYSACGDLANALLFACGIRQQSYVNRAENSSYRIGWNVAKLDSLANSLRNYSKQPITLADIMALELGDVTIVWNRADTTDAHVAVVRELGYDAKQQLEVRTSDYGQGAPLDGKQCVRTVHNGSMLGSRKLQRIIKLDEAVKRYATAEPIPLDTYFGKASTVTSIETLQTLLNDHGASPKLTVDGQFGPKSKAALKAFLGPKAWAVVEDKTK